MITYELTFSIQTLNISILKLSTPNVPDPLSTSFFQFESLIV